MFAMRIFGNGYGMAAPYCDQPFYWLVNTGNGRQNGKGRFYTFSPGYGAQLRSFEWRCPKPGTRRRLVGLEFEVFNAIRGRFGLMWDVSWAFTGMPRGLEEQNAKLAEIRDRLTDHFADYR